MCYFVEVGETALNLRFSLGGTFPIQLVNQPIDTSCRFGIGVSRELPVPTITIRFPKALRWYL